MLGTGDVAVKEANTTPGLSELPVNEGDNDDPMNNNIILQVLGRRIEELELQQGT